MDVYQPCPCGSGKKFKFCCLEVAEEMTKVTRLAENNQPHVALQAVERLHREHPDAAWVYTGHASILFQEGRYAEARDVLQPLVEKQPDHPFAVGLYATAVLSADGWPAARQAVYRAFQKAQAAPLPLTSGLALGLASLMFADEKHLACRKYLALAMRLAREQDQQDIFLRLLQFDGDGRIFFPLRSVHHLDEYAPAGEELQKETRKAYRLAELGCFEPAARLFTRLAEQDPERAELWYNLGLCRAWDGDEPRAAEALHRAAKLYADFERAAECETLAQLLDLMQPEGHIKVVTDRYSVQSVGRLLTQLGQSDRFARLHVPPEEDSDEPQPAGMFDLLDRPLETWSPGRPLVAEELPRVTAQLVIFDADKEHGDPPRALLSGFDDERFQSARELLQQVAGDQIERDGTDEEDEDLVESMPRELYALQWRWRFPDETPAVERRRIEYEQWQRTASEFWPNQNLAALGGKTPREAAGDESLRLALRGAVHVFDAVCDRSRFQLDIDGLCRELQIDPPRPIEIRDNLPLQTFSSMQLIRLPVAELNDQQLIYTLNRALLIHHGRFLYRVLKEALSRPACLDKIDLNRAYMTLVDLCREQFRRAEALEWVARGRERAKTDEKPFEAGLHWTLAELNLRLEDPSDPELRPLLQHLMQVYGPKLPQLRGYLEEVVTLYRLPISLEELGGTPVGATTPGGLWTPASAESTPEGARKLWMPGQD